MRVIRQRAFDRLQDAQHDPARAGRTVRREVSAEADQVFDRLGRSGDVHGAKRFGAGRSRLRPQELTQSSTS
jgi:hypothetical protein